MMNRKNPGLVEEYEPMSQEERHFYLYSALGWTVAAILYTAYTFWRGDPRKHDSALLGWLLAAWSWGYWLYERRKANRNAQKEGH